MTIPSQGTLNALASLPLETRRKVRTALQDALSTDSPLSSDNELQKRAFHPVDNVKLHLPVFVGDYTDFCECTPEHAAQMLLPDLVPAR
jgi:hypothetical protein